MAKILERIKGWRRGEGRAQEEPSSDASKDWKTVGNKFRASDAVTSVPPTYFPSADEGRPPH
jgi:hypothetical protein